MPCTIFIYYAIYPHLHQKDGTSSAKARQNDNIINSFSHRPITCPSSYYYTGRPLSHASRSSFPSNSLSVFPLHSSSPQKQLLHIHSVPLSLVITSPACKFSRFIWPRLSSINMVWCMRVLRGRLGKCRGSSARHAEEVIESCEDGEE